MRTTNNPGDVGCLLPTRNRTSQSLLKKEKSFYTLNPITYSVIMKTSSVMKCLRIFPLIVVLMLQGFAGSISAEAATKNSAAKAATAPAAWKCEETKDGIGVKFSCVSTTDDRYNHYVLTLMCNSEQKLAHTIIRFDAESNVETWGYQKSIKVRVDSKPLETWTIGTRGSGVGLYFKKGTKFLLTKIATAKTFGFKAIGEDGSPYSALFNVQNSVPIAAKFAAMGCKTELG